MLLPPNAGLLTLRDDADKRLESLPQRPPRIPRSDETKLLFRSNDVSFPFKHIATEPHNAVRTETAS